MESRGVRVMERGVEKGTSEERNLTLSPPRVFLQAKEWILEQLEYLKTSRPTAVNLFNDCARLAAFVKGLEGTGDEILEG